MKKQDENQETKFQKSTSLSDQMACDQPENLYVNILKCVGKEYCSNWNLKN